MRDLREIPGAELERFLAAGGQVILYEICVSLLFLTHRRPVVVLVPAGENRIYHALPYLLVSVLLGWWGIPWGMIYTPLVLFTNLRGGVDVTAQARELFGQV
jgi:hypothetical protein